MSATRSVTFKDIQTLRRPRFSKAEFMKRGKELYEQIRPQVEEGNRGKIVAIDLETGTYEVAADTLHASERLLARCPDAQTWFVRIGYDDLFRIGRGVASSVTDPTRPSISTLRWSCGTRSPGLSR